MKSGPTKDVEELFHHALDREPSERDAFLKKACAGDEALLREVKSLLAADGQAERFIEEPAAEAATQVASPARTAGTRLGPYEILAPLGAGGMGEVYRARDTRLGRDVALKVLPAHLSAHPELRLRLEREARAVSQLSHPHICTLHDVGREDGTDFLVMEYLEGKTLAHRLEKGALPLEEALRTAADLAEALDTAHRHGVVHRDLKPGNIMLTKAGPKLLDFGLARLRETGAGQEAESLSQRPTQAQTLTEEGKVVGTYPYMAPEQLEGRPADARTDLFAFGAVLYEMVTGRRAFEGKSRPSLIAAIMSSQPRPIAELQPMTPPLLDRVVRRCLEKDPDERWQSAGDLAAELRWIVEGAPLDTTPSLGRRAWWRRFHLVWAALTVVLLVTSVLGLFDPFRSRDPGPAQREPLRRFTLRPEKLLNATVSPDGKHIAYVTGVLPDTSLWVQDLDQNEPRQLEGTEQALSPFWSPDSTHIGFFIRNQVVKKVSVLGGAAMTLCDLPGPHPSVSRLKWGGTWSPDGSVIVFSSGRPERLYTVPARGGLPQPLFQDSEDGERQDFPQFWPGDGHGAVIVFEEGNESSREIVVQNLATGARRVLGAGSDPVVCRTGHVIYHSLSQASPALLAHPLSETTLEPTGDPFRIAERGSSASVANDGTLVYIERPGPSQSQLVRRDRGGTLVGLVGPPQDKIWTLGLSPSGDRVAVVVWEKDERSLWSYEVDRPVTRRLTLPGLGFNFPTWSPSGDWIAYNAEGEESRDIFIASSHGNSQPDVLVASGSNEYVDDWSPDGRFVVYSRVSLETGDEDLWYLEMRDSNTSSEPVPFVRGPGSQKLARFSPDGRFVAYLSRESGRSEIYIERFPEGGGKVQVSTEGACRMRWGRNGEIFYMKLIVKGDQVVPPTEAGSLIAVPVKTTPDLQIGEATTLFEVCGHVSGYSPHYDVSPDGQWFVVSEPVGGPTQPVIRIVQNWFEEFRDQQGGPE